MNASMVMLMLVLATSQAALTFRSPVKRRPLVPRSEPLSEPGVPLDRRGLTDISTKLTTNVDTKSFGPTCIKTACPTSNIPMTYCDSICSGEADNFYALNQGWKSCLRNPICGVNFNSFKITGVNVPIAISNYNGTCALVGSAVTITGGTRLRDFVQIVNEDNPYYIYHVTVGPLVWTGLSVQCTAYQPINTTALQGAVPDLLAQLGVSGLLSGLLCPVNNLLGNNSLGLLNLGILNCSLNNPSNPSFSGAVKIKQKLYEDFTFNISGINSGFEYSDYSTTLRVKLPSSVPRVYQPDLITSITQALSTQKVLYFFDDRYTDLYIDMLIYYLIPNCRTCEDVA